MLVVISLYIASAISQFLEWCESRKLELHTLEPIIIAAYIEELGGKRSPTTVKQNLAAIRMLMDYLVVGQVLPFNPVQNRNYDRGDAFWNSSPPTSATRTRGAHTRARSRNSSSGVRVGNSSSTRSSPSSSPPTSRSSVNGDRRRR